PGECPMDGSGTDSICLPAGIPKDLFEAVSFRPAIKSQTQHKAAVAIRRSPVGSPMINQIRQIRIRDFAGEKGMKLRKKVLIFIFKDFFANHRLMTGAGKVEQCHAFIPVQTLFMSQTVIKDFFYGLITHVRESGENIPDKPLFYPMIFNAPGKKPLRRL